jgi:hypothetical protein
MPIKLRNQREELSFPVRPPTVGSNESGWKLLTYKRGFGMITLEDCVALCGLTEQEVLAIAEHEHVPEIAAAAVARYLLKEPHGAEKIRDMMRDDIHEALNRGDRDHASELLMVLRHFLATHPEAKRSLPQWVRGSHQEEIEGVRSRCAAHRSVLGKQHFCRRR